MTPPELRSVGHGLRPMSSQIQKNFLQAANSSSFVRTHGSLPTRKKTAFFYKKTGDCCVTTSLRLLLTKQTSAGTFRPCRCNGRTRYRLSRCLLYPADMSGMRVHPYCSETIFGKHPFIPLSTREFSVKSLSDLLFSSLRLSFLTACGRRFCLLRID